MDCFLNLVTFILHQSKINKEEKKNAANASLNLGFLSYTGLAVSNLFNGRGILINLSILEAEHFNRCYI
ncbi:hypothetical protein [Enterococcus rivorum]|uniref:hypothetical protein n=1 Tax=Enterococcus rivorum TaxID=762845 RepID=UPI00363E11AF